jgi:hypothetical protein
MKPAVEVTAAVTGHHLILSATDEGKLTPERYQQFLSMRYYDGAPSHSLCHKVSLLKVKYL